MFLSCQIYSLYLKQLRVLQIWTMKIAVLVKLNEMVCSLKLLVRILNC